MVTSVDRIGGEEEARTRGGGRHSRPTSGWTVTSRGPRKHGDAKIDRWSSRGRDRGSGQRPPTRVPGPVSAPVKVDWQRHCRAAN